MKNIIIISAIMIAECFCALLAQKISVGYIYPSGAQQGTVAEVTVGGLNVRNATSVYVSGKDVTAEIIRTDETNIQGKKRKKLDDQSSPQLADRITLRVTVNKKAKPGLRDLRLESAAGVSNKLYFEVGQYPDFREIQGSTLQKPNEVENLPVVLCGQIMPGESDYFRFAAEGGTTLVAAVKGRALVPFIADAVPGWFQPVLSIRNSQGKEVAYCDDYRDNADPVIIFRVPATDTYILSIRDAIYRGREDFNYRIELGKIPFIESVWPVVSVTGKKNTLRLVGVNLKSDKINYKSIADGYNHLSVKGENGALSNEIAFWGVNKSRKLRTDFNPADDPQLQQVYYDSLTTHTKVYPFYAQAGENALFEITARRIGSLLDARLRLTDSHGKLLAESDDTEDEMQGLMTFHADPVLRYKFEVPGNYYLQVEDVLDNRGSDYFYVLQKKNAIDPFRVFVSPAIVSISRGGTAIVTATIDTKEKLNKRIALHIDGLPSGSKVSNLTVPTGAKKKEFSVTLPEKSAMGDFDLKLTAAPVGKDEQAEERVQKAVAVDDMMQAFYYHHNIPAAGFSLKVTPRAPYRIEFSDELWVDNEYRLTAQGSDSVIDVPVRIVRDRDFKEPIELSVYPKSRLLSVQNATILPDESEKMVHIVISKDPKRKTTYKTRYTLAIVGTVKGEVNKTGKRVFENAAYREMSPLIVISR